MRGSTRALGTRPAFALLGVVIVVALVLGSHHHALPTKVERIANLESIIKCPSCDDLTIAQSSSSEALGLKSQVAHFVDIGESDDEIEAYVERKYPGGEILTPHGTSGAVAVGIPIAAFVIAVSIMVTTFIRRRRSPGNPQAPDGADLALVTAALADRREQV